MGNGPIKTTPTSRSNTCSARLNVIENRVCEADIRWGLSECALFEDQWEAYDILSDHDASLLLSQLDSFLGRASLPRTQAFKVAFTEALSNALYHAQGRPKGSISKKPLPSSIHCELGFNDQYLYGSIRDNCGCLSAELIHKYLESAQSHEYISVEKLEETHQGGRGLFLIASLIETVRIGIQPGRHTEVRLIQPRHISVMRQGQQTLQIITAVSESV
jgi:anti-sigma regulatory factor (Ser/Thr protein kinase)